jgi:hypothetical protein
VTFRTRIQYVAAITGLLAAGATLVEAHPAMLAAPAAAVARLPAPGAAQQPGTVPAAGADSGRLLQGVVIGPDGNVVPGVPIALHRVAESGGAMVDEVGSDSIGRFTINVAEDDPADALYFVAARYQGELYIGPSFRPPFPEGSEYVVQVGIAETSASRIMSGVDADGVIIRPPASPWRWGIAAVVAAALIGFVVAIIIRARGPGTRRRLLIRVAELDEAHAAEYGAAAGDAAWAETGVAAAPAARQDDATHEEYLARRDELIEQIRALR